MSDINLKSSPFTASFYLSVVVAWSAYIIWHMDTNYNTPQGPSSPQLLRPRPLADVPQDVDFLQEHLNDPNYDLNSNSKSLITAGTLIAEKAGDLNHDSIEKHDFSTTSTELDIESQIESARCSIASRMSDFTDFDEYVYRGVVEIL